MKVSDLVQRKTGEWNASSGGYGIILSLYSAGKPVHRCANILWGNDNKIYGIGCSRIEVVNEVGS